VKLRLAIASSGSEVDEKAHFVLRRHLEDMLVRESPLLDHAPGPVPDLGDFAAAAKLLSLRREQERLIHTNLRRAHRFAFARRRVAALSMEKRSASMQNTEIIDCVQRRRGGRAPCLLLSAQRSHIQTLDLFRFLLTTEEICNSMTFSSSPQLLALFRINLFRSRRIIRLFAASNAGFGLEMSGRVSERACTAEERMLATECQSTYACV
jgi:hypothetical protein